MNYCGGNKDNQGVNSPDNKMLVAAKEIAGVDLICHILKLFCHTVGDNDVGLLFEGGEITFQARVEE